MCRTAFMPPRQLQRHLRRSAAFTLVELLVVIALIAVLAALSIGALVFLPDKARVRATEATITKLSTALDRKLAAVQQARSTVRPNTVDLWLSGGTASVVGGKIVVSGGNPSLAQVIALIRTLRQELPEEFGTGSPSSSSSARYSSYDWHASSGALRGDWSLIDLTVPAGITPPPGFVQPVQDWPSGAQLFEARISQADLNKHTAETTRAELLYLILSATGGVGGGTEEFAPDEIRDTDGDGVPEFVDKWGRPIQFFLWPTEHEKEHPSLGSASNANDPNLLLMDSIWVGSTPRPFFERLFHWVTKDGPGASPQARSYPTIPLIVSAGPDGEFGLMKDATTGQFDPRAMKDAANGGFDDNIDNHNLRVR